MASNNLRSKYKHTGVDAGEMRNRRDQQQNILRKTDGKSRYEINSLSVISEDLCKVNCILLLFLVG